MFAERLAGRHRPIVAAHRGSSGGNIVSNTINAFTAAIRLGADIVECDVAKTRDGRLILFHDTLERLFFGVAKSVTAMTFPELKELGYYNSNDVRTNQKAQELGELFKNFRGRAIFNLDRCWDHWDLIIEEVERYDMASQVLLKSPPLPHLLKTLESYPKKYMYMPIVRTIEDYRVVRGYDINLVAIEVLFKTTSDPTADRRFIQQIRNDGCLAWCNSLKLSERHFLCGDYDDDVSILQGPEHGWGKILDLGFDIIQTDWPSLLREYISTRN